MEVKRVFSQEIENQMSEIGFELFDADLTDTTIVALDQGRIAGFIQDENGTVYEIESRQKGAGRIMVEWLKSQEDFITVENSGRDSWGFWEKMGFSQNPPANDYYATFEWEF